MKDYLKWKLDTHIRTDVVKSMDTLAAKETANVSRGDLSKSEYIIREAWSYYPWVEALFKKSEVIIGRPISGRVADIGSGTGVVAAILSKLENVKEVFAIEYSEEHVKSIMPITFQHLGAKEEKITRVVGSFNDIKVQDNFFDFILEVGSLHHAEDLDATLKELRRVLTPGGYVIAADRAHQNWVSDDYLARFLDREMNPKQKRIYGLPEHFTRRMWGEHEYRYRDWKAAFRRCGFEASAFSFPGRNPALLRAPLKVFFSLFGDWMLKRKIDSLPYYRWFLPYFRGPNALIVAKKL
jgi:SAM-dependent methyltransferase